MHVLSLVASSGDGCANRWLFEKMHSSAENTDTSKKRHGITFRNFSLRSFLIAFTLLATGTDVGAAFSRACAETESDGADPWRDLACVELLG